MPDTYALLHLFLLALHVLDIHINFVKHPMEERHYQNIQDDKIFDNQIIDTLLRIQYESLVYDINNSYMYRQVLVLEGDRH